MKIITLQFSERHPEILQKEFRMSMIGYKTVSPSWYRKLAEAKPKRKGPLFSFAKRRSTLKPQKP